MKISGSVLSFSLIGLQKIFWGCVLVRCRGRGKDRRRKVVEEVC